MLRRVGLDKTHLGRVGRGCRGRRDQGAGHVKRSDACQYAAANNLTARHQMPERGGCCPCYRDQAERPGKGGPLQHWRVDPDMTDLRPGKAGKEITAQRFAYGEGNDQRNTAAAKRTGYGKTRRPVECEIRGKPDQREGRHPAVAGDINQKRLDNPAECQHEITSPGDPAHQQGATHVRSLPEQRDDQGQRSDRQRPEPPGRLPQRRQRPQTQPDRNPIDPAQPVHAAGKSGLRHVSHSCGRAGKPSVV